MLSTLKYQEKYTYRRKGTKCAFFQTFPTRWYELQHALLENNLLDSWIFFFCSLQIIWKRIYLTNAPKKSTPKHCIWDNFKAAEAVYEDKQASIEWIRLKKKKSNNKALIIQYFMVSKDSHMLWVLQKLYESGSAAIFPSNYSFTG